MSLFDLIKDKPPVVANSDVPWPPPNKIVDVSGVPSKQTAIPFLTDSPLFPAKRTPSLREFLNPNYRDPREVKSKDSMSETSDLLQAIEKNISSNSLSKTDFDLQRRMRHRSSSTSCSTEEKSLEKVTKATETHTTSITENLDSETELGTLETTKPKNVQNPTLLNLSSLEEQQVLQEENCIDQDVEKCDARSEPSVFHDDDNSQKASEVIDSNKEGRENISTFPVSAEKVSALKRKMTEIKSGMMNDESAKKCKRAFAAGEQENKIFIDENAKIHVVCTPKRKMTDMESMTTDRVLIKKPRKVSQEVCSGGTFEEPRDVQEGLSLGRDDSSGKKRTLDVTNKDSVFPLKPDKGSIQSNNAEEYVDNECTKHKLSVNNESQEHVEERLPEKRTLDMANEAPILPLKADKGNTQSNNAEEDVDNECTKHKISVNNESQEYVEERLSVKRDTQTRSSNKEERTPDTARLSLRAHDGSEQSQTLEPVAQEYTEEVSSMKSNNCAIHSSEDEKMQDAPRESLKAHEGSVEKPVNKEYLEGASSEKSNSHTMHSSLKEGTLDTSKLSLNGHEVSVQSRKVEKSVDKEYLEGASFEKSDSHTTHSSEDEKMQDTPRDSLKAHKGSTQIRTVEKPLDKEYVEAASFEKSDCPTATHSSEDEKMQGTPRGSLKTHKGGTQIRTVEKPVDKEYVEGASFEKSDCHTTHGSEGERKHNTACKVHGLPMKTNERSRQESTSKDDQPILTTADVDADLKKEISLDPDAVCNEQKREDLQVEEQKTQELSLIAQTSTSLPKTKGENTIIHTAKENSMLENNYLEDSSNNNELETEDLMKNRAEITKELLKDENEIPQTPQNVNLQTLLQKTIFVIDSSESSTETEASDIELQEATNQDHCSKEVPDKVTPVSKFKNSLEGTSDLGKDFKQEMASRDLEITHGQIFSDDGTSALSNSVCVEDSSEVDEDDDWDVSDLEGDEESFEVLIFKESDDDDDGLEEGEIEADSSEESCVGESILDKCEQDEDSSESKQKPSGQNIVNVNKTQISKSSKKNKRKKRNRLLKQGKFSKQRKSCPPKKTTAMDRTRRKTSTKPVLEQNTSTCSTSKAAPAKGMQHIENESQGEFSLLSTLANTAVMDVTVAASEKELIKKKTRGGKQSAERRKKLQKRYNAYKARLAERRRQDIRMEPLPRPLCTYYLAGFCNKGDECQFRHEGTPTKNPVLCKFYASGVCEKGDKCPYQHSSYPCKFYHLNTGICKNGIHCRFSHEGPTTETQALFDQLRAEAQREQNNSTDAVDGSGNQNELGTSPNSNVSPVQENPYSVRYGSIDDDDTKGNLTGVQERGTGCKEEPEKPKIEEERQDERSSPAPRPSYLVPGMYTN